MNTAKLLHAHKFVRHALLCYKNTSLANYFSLTKVLLGYASVTCGLFHGEKKIEQLELGGLSLTLNRYSGEVTGFWENFLDDKYGTARRGIKNRCVFDVGGNAGFFTMSQIMQCGNDLTIFTFEPDPEVFQRMSTHAKSCNNGKNARLFPMNIACGAQAGKVRLARHTSCLSHIATDSDDANSCVDVPMRTLDDIVVENNLEHIDLLKMDVEGFEIEVLKGATKSALPITDRVVMQYHDGQLEEGLKILQGLGFRLTWQNEEKAVALFEKEVIVGGGQTTRFRSISQG